MFFLIICSSSSASTLISEDTIENIANEVVFTYLDGVKHIERQVYVYVPNDYHLSEKRYPVLFAFHGTAKNGIGAAKSNINKQLGIDAIIISPVGQQSVIDMRESNNKRNKHIRHNQINHAPPNIDHNSTIAATNRGNILLNGSVNRGPGYRRNYNQLDSSRQIRPRQEQSEGMYTWNATGEGELDDVTFVVSMWNDIKNNIHIDSERVYVYGSSVGSSFVSNKLLPDARVDFIKGAACFASTLVVDTDIKDTHTPLGIIIAHGDADHIIPIDGGMSRIPGAPEQLSVESAIAYWAQQNQCYVEPITDEYTKYTKTYYPGCSVKLEVYRLHGVGHSAIKGMLDIFGGSIGEFVIDSFE